MEISRLHRTVTIVARGRISPDEVRGIAQRLAEPHVRGFAKIVEAGGATTGWTPEQVAGVVVLLRGDAKEKRGPVAFIIAPKQGGFAEAFARQTEGERPISLFKSLREARDWLQRIEHSRANAESASEDQTPWSDPQREGVLIRGEKQRDVRISLLTEA